MCKMKLESKLMVTNSHNYNIVIAVYAVDDDHDDDKMDEVPNINYVMLILNKTEEAELITCQHMIC